MKTDYIRAKQAAHILKCSHSYVYRLANSGVFTKYYISATSYRLSKSEVVSYIQFGKARTRRTLCVIEQQSATAPEQVMDQ